jgi:hypothetical protein
MFAKIAGVIERAGLQIGAWRADLGKGGLGQTIGGDILDRGIGDFMDETDVFIFTGHNEMTSRWVIGIDKASRPRHYSRSSRRNIAWLRSAASRLNGGIISENQKKSA